MANNFTVATYSPSDVQLTIAGYTIAGWDRITITRRTDSFKPVYGIRSKHTRVPSGSPSNKDTSAILTFSLSQESTSNDILSDIHAMDIANGTGRLPITLKDLSGQSVFSSDEAYILSFPESAFVNDFSNRDWRIFCQTTKTYKVGGNTSPQSSILDTAASFISSIF